VKVGRSGLLYVGVGRSGKKLDGVGVLILLNFFCLLKKYYLCFALVTKNSFFVKEILDVFVFLCSK